MWLGGGLWRSNPVESFWSFCESFLERDYNIWIDTCHVEVTDDIISRIWTWYSSLKYTVIWLTSSQFLCYIMLPATSRSLHVLSWWQTSFGDKISAFVIGFIWYQVGWIYGYSSSASEFSVSTDIFIWFLIWLQLFGVKVFDLSKHLSSQWIGMSNPKYDFLRYSWLGYSTLVLWCKILLLFSAPFSSTKCSCLGYFEVRPPVKADDFFDFRTESFGPKVVKRLKPSYHGQ